jgi:hypothetical protein
MFCLHLNPCSHLDTVLRQNSILREIHIWIYNINVHLTALQFNRGSPRSYYPGRAQHN